VVTDILVHDGEGTALPKLNGNSGHLKRALNVRVTTNGASDCLPVVVTVYPAGGGAATGSPLVANGVAGAGGVYTTIFGEKATSWVEGPLLVRVTWGSTGSQDLVVAIAK
jgi:hypothetical protein